MPIAVSPSSTTTVHSYFVSYVVTTKGTFSNSTYTATKPVQGPSDIATMEAQIGKSLGVTIRVLFWRLYE